MGVLLASIRIADTEGTASMATVIDTDASNDEYGTFAPAGETCPVCMKAIRTLEPVRRGSLGRVSGPPVVVYRHAPKCP